MPRRAQELNAKQVAGLRHPGNKSYPVKVAVGGVAGLYVQIQPSNDKSWVLRTRFGDWEESRLSSGKVQKGRKKREFGLGSLERVKLADARERARDYLAKIDMGIDPVAERKAARKAMQADLARASRTFASVFEEYAAEKTKEFSTDKYRKQWRRAVEEYAFPVLGGMPIDEIELEHILRVLEPIWHDKTETASKLRGKLDALLSFAKVKGYRSGENPAAWRGNLQHVLPAPGKIKTERHEPAVQVKDAARWWAVLRSIEGMAARSLEFQALTATRSGAVRAATWDEIDFEAKLWTVQPGRQFSKIKASGKAQRVPLTDRMIELLEGLPRLEDSDYVFWAPKGGALSDMALGKAMKAVHDADGNGGFIDAASKDPAVPHGLRSTFRTWVAEQTSYDGDMAEVALWHKVGSKVQQAYDRSELIEKRRDMMAVWGEFLAATNEAKILRFSRQ
jgi:integrase